MQGNPFHRMVLLGLMPVMALASTRAQIPNASFENWVDHSGYIEPEGWITYNDTYTPQGYFTTVEPGYPGAVGNSYAWIQSRTTPSGSTIQGWMSAAPAGHGEPAGFPYSARPAELTGQWQYGIQPGDTAEVLVALGLVDDQGNLDPVALGTLEVTGQQNGWTTFTVPLTYYSETVPDRAFIMFSASKDFAAPVAGSFLKVDDLAFAGWVGMDEHAVMHNLLLYPTPTTGTLHVQGSAPMKRITVLDAAGRALLEKDIRGETAQIDVPLLAPGVYFLAVEWASGERRIQRFLKL
ncbi:MAG TPA: T9SS type A sorting domain-containing protein [Flavobacteriales bacterium]|nr:T9SS type A sorting domain-containing protein [Flavobacteriales bacterium]HRO39261.1 T9SS type A sorting domain-containing protein [Flavobacteriales bacterium]HRP80817.1 T9SS type A sorting domain-containing protein [Flavobacteriales bacterium]HRQ85226.1 T9SS type A sorting domain-containing protein [Flavobacteriales bacterium]